MPLPEIERKSVSWKGLDVLLFFFLWFAALIASDAIAHITSAHTQPQVQATTADKEDHGHPVAQLIEQSKNSPIVFLVAFISVVVVAPILEELLFRLLLQGWLAEKLLQFHVPSARGVAIVIVSCFFAVIHSGNYRSHDVQVLFYNFALFSVLSILIFTSGIIYLVRKRNVNIVCYLFGSGRFFSPQFLTNAGYCLLALLFVYGLTAILKAVYPNSNVSPIPIFFFSLVLGTLYSKTQNLSYCVLFHSCLNGTSLMMVCILA